MDTGLRRPESEVNHAPPSSVKDKNGWHLTLLRVYAFITRTGTTTTTKTTLPFYRVLFVIPYSPNAMCPDFITHLISSCLLTYLLTPWCRVFLEQLTGLQLVKKFPVFHGTRRFITALTSVRQLSLSWSSTIQSIYPHPTSWRSILILSTHLRLGLPSGSFRPVSPPRPYTPPLLTHTRHMPSPSHSSRFYHPHNIG